MYALGPKYIGKSINIDDIQLFVDFCNLSVLNGDAHTSVILPTFKAICLSMEIEIVRDGQEVLKSFDLNQEERNYVEKLFSASSWFTVFTDRTLLQDFIPLANDESAEIINSILGTVKPDYKGPLFIISTVRLGTVEESTIPKVVEPEQTQPAQS